MGGYFTFYSFVPSGKSNRSTKDLVGDLENGDEIVTAGGIHGSVTKVMEDDLLIEVEDGTILKIQQDSIVETKSDEDDLEVEDEEDKS